MEEKAITYWKYQFIWRNVPCEARDGRIFINNRPVEELNNVNISSQTTDRFFVDGRDVTEICVRYLPKVDQEIESLKERIVTATGQSLAGASRARDTEQRDREAEEKEQSKKNIFGLRARKGRSSGRPGKAP